MRPGQFLCGCDANEKWEDVFNNPTTFDSMKIDEEGYLVCRIHGQRQYGWRSDSYVKIGSQSVFDQIRARQDRNLPPLWWPHLWPPPIVLGPIIASRRDDRDPQEIGEWMTHSITRGGEGMSASDRYDLATGTNMPPLPQRDPFLTEGVRPGGRKLMEYHRELATRTQR